MYKRQHAFSDEFESMLATSDISIIFARDLCRTILSGRKYNWNREQLIEDLLESGRQFAVPQEYQLVGKVRKLFPKLGVASISLNSEASVKIGDTISFRGTDSYNEVVLESIQVNSLVVDAVDGPKDFGIKIGESVFSKLKSNQCVYLRRCRTAS